VGGQPSNAGANLGWDAPASNGYPVTGYVVTPYLNGVRQTPTTFTTAATVGRVGGLTNGATYTFTVAGINRYGTGAVSAPSKGIVIGSPTAPGVLQATAGNGSVTLQWNAPGHDNGSPITGYVLTPFERATPLATRVINSAATTTMITGLTNGTPYHFKLAAINTNGVGPLSPASSVVTPGTPTSPGAITASAGAGSSVVHWSAPASDNGYAVTAYVVTPFLAGVAQPARTFNSAATTQTVTGLSPGSYTFRVAAENRCGIGPGSGYSTPVTIT
jgi:predicted phage tail protein